MFVYKHRSIPTLYTRTGDYAVYKILSHLSSNRTGALFFLPMKENQYPQVICNTYDRRGIKRIFWQAFLPTPKIAWELFTITRCADSRLRLPADAEIYSVEQNQIKWYLDLFHTQLARTFSMWTPIPKMDKYSKLVVGTKVDIQRTDGEFWCCGKLGVKFRRFVYRHSLSFKYNMAS